MPDNFRAGDVLEKAGSILLQNLWPLLAVAATARLLPTLIEALAAPPAASNLAIGLLALLLVILGQALIAPGAMAALRGRPIGVAASFTLAFSRLLPITGLVVIMVAAFSAPIEVVVLVGTKLFDQPGVVGVLVGLALAYVPGPMLYVTWFVAVPACVVERLGPFASMGRSRVLTKGYRLKIFGLTLVVLIPAALVTAQIEFAAWVASLPEVADHLLEVTWSTVWTAYFAALVTTIYHDLRVVREGVDTKHLPAVFD